MKNHICDPHWAARFANGIGEIWVLRARKLKKIAIYQVGNLSSLVKVVDQVSLPRLSLVLCSLIYINRVDLVNSLSPELQLVLPFLPVIAPS